MTVTIACIIVVAIQLVTVTMDDQSLRRLRAQISDLERRMREVEIEGLHRLDEIKSLKRSRSNDEEMKT